ncbi:hypothetical protein Rhe02_01990 [Rhizocola hellebori]|uniref:PASTA domain-containing protein n=1 Tax=Rhizocola hellebori TaxID=1392758 RepID=A0A8J3Q291_9ACTN|nr:PASTA domain-containing protein [Rhizocola hellebori]GIH02132.1 hypothetical protein Rhe02_01990 [Rhizocola hellebori]
MSTKWVVTTATERVTLDNTRSAEITFTVTNQAERSARALFDIRTGTGVDTSWFAIDDPQRLVRPAASVPYLVRIAVPAQVAPGSYDFEARVCPPDAAPEENFVLSRRVLLEVPAPPAPPKRKWPWWLIAIAAAILALVIGVITWLAWPTAQAPQALPSPTPSVSPAVAAEYVPVPKVIGLSLPDALTSLQKAGFTQGTTVYRFEPGSPNLVTRQGMPPGTLAVKGSRMDMEIFIPTTKPTILSPKAGSNVTPNSMPLVTWSAAQPTVSRWLVTVQPERCSKTAAGTETCSGGPLLPAQLVGAREHMPPLPTLSYVDTTKAGWRHNGFITIYVQPVDDIGLWGEPASIRLYLEH